MPFTGGWTPSPERYGGSVPLLQRVFESISAQRGDAYDQTTASSVGVENMAYARAITFDGWGTNQRLINGFFPSTMTAASGMLQRWEKIFGVPPVPGDPEPVRRARVAAAWSRIGNPNSIQPVIDALSAALGPIFVGVNHVTFQNSVGFVNGISQVIESGTSPLMSVTGTPNNSYQIIFTVTFTGGLGLASYSVSYDNNRTVAGTGIIIGTVPLTGTGLTGHFPTGTYHNGDTFSFQTSPGVPWTSNLARLSVQLTYAPNGYNTGGVPNAAFFQLAANINPILDQMLPAWTVWNWFVDSSHSAMEFRLDEHNLDLEAFGS